MLGTGTVRVAVASHQVQHQFWLVNIQDSCIIGLDLLCKWGAVVDVSILYLGTKTVALHKSNNSGARQTSVPPLPQSEPLGTTILPQPKTPATCIIPPS